MLTRSDVDRLACPTCRAPLAFHGREVDARLAEGHLACASCAARWPVAGGLAQLYREELVAGNDRLLRHFYDGLPWLHDPAVRYTLPVFQSGTERAFRDAYMPRLALDALRPREDGAPLRILEIGVGCGANLPLIRRDLPRGLPVEIWGCDLSAGMIGVLRGRLQKRPDERVRLLQCDAHALPFADASFDRVFQIGAVNSYRDPRLALAEMARVARPGTPIVVVDEQLDPRRAHSLYHRLVFRAVTFYDAAPHAPLEHLPEGAADVVEEQLSRFFYCLRFRLPAPDRGAPAPPR